MIKKVNILSMIFAFLFSFFLFLGTYAFTAQITILNQGYLLQSFERSGFYQGMADELNLYFQQSSGGAGIDPSVYDNYITEQEVESVIKTVVTSSFNKEEVTIDVTTFKTNLKVHLLDEMAKQRVDVATIDDTSLNAYIDDTAKTYHRLLSLPFISYAVTAVEMLSKVTPFLIGAALFVVVVSGYFLWRLQKREKTGYRFIYNAFMSCGLMAIIPALFMIFGNYIKRVDLSPECYYRFMVSFLETYFWYVILIAALYIIIGGIFIILQSKSDKSKLCAIKQPTGDIDPNEKLKVEVAYSLKMEATITSEEGTKNLAETETSDNQSKEMNTTSEVEISEIPKEEATK